MEIPPTARIVLSTTKGRISIELFAKETPTACKKFLSNLVNGDYNNATFTPQENLIQVDPVAGGEPFAPEFHSRLRFSVRGCVGLLRSDQYASAEGFFITTQPAPELNNRHVMIGRVTGDSFYNVMKIHDGEKGPDGAPLYPAKVTGVEVEEACFEDLGRREKRQEEEINEKNDKPAPRKRKRVALSFDEDEDVEDTGFVMRSAHEALRKGGNKGDENERQKGELEVKSETETIEKNNAKPDTVETEKADREETGNADTEETGKADTEESGKADIEESGKAGTEETEKVDAEEARESADVSHNKVQRKKGPMDPTDPLIDIERDDITFAQLQAHRFVWR